ncbi:hypothetical protein N8Z63_03680 [Octadecabacter sp.]|nr:hypothetical protein [Octadecabacter sp.]
MDNVYNRSLFSKNNRPARQKLQKMGGIMASSPELMEAAQKAGSTPNQNMGGAGASKMANLGPPPMPMAPPMPMPMPSSVQMPTPPVKPMAYDEGGEVEVVDITKTPTSSLNNPGFATAFEQYLGTTPMLANKLDEAYGSREVAAAEAAKTKDAIDAAIATENTDNIVNTVLDQAGMPLNEDSKKEFARSVFGMEDVNDIDEINKRIADVAIGSSIGKGPDAFAEAVLLGLGEYKKTATARASAKSGGKSGMSPLEPFADAVRDLAGKLVAARGVDIDTAMQQAAAALAPYYGAGGGVPVTSPSGPSLEDRRTLVEEALKSQPDKRELILDQAAKDGVNIEGL